MFILSSDYLSFALIIVVTLVFFKELIIASKDGDYNLTKQLIGDGASLEEFDINGKLFYI